MTIIYDMTKICFKCKEHLLVTEFTVNEYNKSGYSSYCKSCMRKNRAKQHADIKSDPIKLAEHRKWGREYYHKNKERIKLNKLTK